MIRRIDHISIAVRDLQKAKSFFLEVLGGKELFAMALKQQKYRWTTIELGTSCFIELIDPLEKDGFLHRFLESRGEGLHHITIQVNDIGKIQKALEERGIPTFGYSEDLPGWKELFIHPRHSFGALIQLAEFNPLDWISPGYIPPSYWEFAPPEEIGTGQERVKVRRVENEKGPQLELRQGDKTICLPLTQLGDLIQALNAASGP